MKRLLTILILAIASSAAFAQGFNNPVVKGFSPDPSVCRVGEDYYLVTSSFQYFPGVPIYHSKDLVNWKQIGHVLTRESQLQLEGANSSQGIYAPTIRHHNGKFYMITTNTSSLGNFIVTAEDPAGEWSDPIPVKMGGIDPSLFWDEDGKCWYTGSTGTSVMISQINPDTGEILTEPKIVWNGMGGRYPEAPHIYKKDGWYYLMIAEGGTEFAHSETIARSRNVEGPYDPAPHNPILTHFASSAQSSPIQGVGHADLVEAHDGSWWLVCLAFRVNSGLIHLLGRETFVAPVRWDKNAWPVVNGNGQISLKMDVPTLPQKPFEAEPARNEFDEPLGPKWSWLRKPVTERYQVADGKLRMYGSAEGLNELQNSPSFVGFRQEDFDFQAETCVQLGKASNGDKAGMTVYMDYNGHYDIYLQKKGGKWVVGTNYTFGPVNHVEEVVVNSGKVWLRLTGNRSQYMLWYSTDGKDFKQVGTGDARFLSTETLGNFTGIMLGLWAQSPSVKGYADFEYFEYKQVEPQRPMRRRPQ